MTAINPLALLFLFALLFGAHILLHFSFDPQSGWRNSSLAVATIWGFGIWAVSELLSFFHLLSFWPILGAWVAAALIIVAASLVRRRTLAAHVRSAYQDFRKLRLGWIEYGLAAGVVVIAATLALVAWTAAPNNYDSLTYHLARVMHWLQNRSIDFYPTHIARQLYLGPGAELIVLQLQALTGGDRLANFVQWAAMLGSVVGATRIAKQLGGSGRAQLLAAIASATVPMAILQATSTQNDAVVGFWLICFVAFGLALKQAPSLKLCLLTGSALGLAVLAKPVAGLYAAPFAVWIGASILKQYPAAAIKYAVLISATAILVNVGQAARNDALFGSVLGPQSEGPGYSYTNDLYTPAAFASNVSRNLALHLGLPRLDQVNRFVENAIVKLHAGLGLAIDDPRTTWGKERLHIAFSRHEDTAGNPLHLTLIVGALGVLAVLKRSRSPSLILFAACLAGAFFLFCLLLRWQPWNSRLHLPLFLLAMPLVAVVYERSLPRTWVPVLMLLLLAQSLPYLFRNQLRPLTGQDSILAKSRTSQYFAAMPAWESPYRGMVQVIHDLNCQRVGLEIQGDQWEYPLWALAQELDFPVEYEHVNVQNPSGRLSSDFTPCAILRFSTSSEDIELGGKTFQSAFEAGPMQLYVGVVPPPPPPPKNLYVATDGSDDNPGTLAAPFQTIQRCAALATPGFTCWIRAGVYHETVTPANSGTAEDPIVFAPYNHEVVVIDGTDPVTGWVPYRDQIFQAPAAPDPLLPANQVFADGAMLNQARWPNSGPDPLRPTWAHAGAGTTQDTLLDSALPPLDFNGAIAHIWGGTNAFVHQTGIVSATAPGQASIAGLLPTCPWICLAPGTAYFLLGNLDALDSPGEWYYDAGANKLFLWAPDGGDPSVHAVVIKQRLYAFDLRGLSFVHISGLSLFANTIILDDSSSDNIIESINARYLSHVNTLDPPASPLLADEGVTGQLVASHADDTGLIIRGTNNIVQDSALAFSAANGVFLGGSHNTLKNTIIHDVGYLGSYATAVYITGHDQTVTHNTIYATGRDGITVDWHLAGLDILNNTIDHNDISDFGILSVDAAGVYLCCSLNGAGTSIAYNLIHDAGQSGPQALLAGLYPDNNSSEFLFHHNVTWNTGSAVSRNGESSNGFYNNTFVTGAAKWAGKLFNNIAPQARLVQAQGNLPSGTDPLFAGSADQRFDLASGSPAIDLGQSFLGINRTIAGPRPDAGAYEFGLPMWAAGSSGALKAADRLIQAELFASSHAITLSEAGTAANFVTEAWALYSNIDFGTGISAIELQVSLPVTDTVSEIEVHADGARGPLIASLRLAPLESPGAFGPQTFPVRPLEGQHDIFLVSKRGPGPSLDWFVFHR